MAGVSAISESSQQTTALGTRSLGAEDFLNLLISQLRQQDPLEPVENTEFIAQMSQLNALEQLQNLNSNFKQLIMMQQLDSYREDLAFSASLLGRLVEAINPDTGEVIKGEVQGFYQKEGAIWLQLEQGTFPVAWIEKVAVAQVDGDSR